MSLDQRPGSDPMCRLRGWADTTFFFSEYGHVAYQIKGNDACSNMVTYSLPADLPPTLWWIQKVKIQLFSEHSHVAYQIK